MNYYEILGLKNNATQKEIKAAFISLSKKHHPDAGGDTEEFKKINKAYQTLKDPEKKEHYDKFGKDRAREPSIQDELIAVFSQCITTRDFNQHHIINHIIGEINSKIEKLKIEKAMCSDTINSLEKYRSRVSSKQTDNLFEGVVDSKIIEVKSNMGTKDVGIERCKKMLDILNDYDDNLGLFEDIKMISELDED